MIDPVPEVQPLDVQPLAPPAPSRHSLIYRIFVGPRGVRAGWKVLLFFLIFAAVYRYAMRAGLIARYSAETAG